MSGHSHGLESLQNSPITNSFFSGTRSTYFISAECHIWAESWVSEMVNCEISALLIWIHVANRAGGGTEQFTLLKRSEVMSGVSDGLLPAQMIPTDHWTFSVVSVARIRCVPPEARPSLLREREVTGSRKNVKMTMNSFYWMDEAGVLLWQ